MLSSARARGRDVRREVGTVVVEAVIVVPVAMVVVLFAVQACLWAHAAALVQSAAAEGDQAACDIGGSVPSGVARAQELLSAVPGSVTAPSVTSSQPAAGEVEIDVRATAESVIPWLHLSVSAARRGTVQEFRSTE